MRISVGYVVVIVMGRVVYPFRRNDFGICKVHNSLVKAYESHAKNGAFGRLFLSGLASCSSIIASQLEAQIATAYPFALRRDWRATRDYVGNRQAKRAVKTVPTGDKILDKKDNLATCSCTGLLESR